MICGCFQTVCFSHSLFDLMIFIFFFVCIYDLIDELMNINEIKCKTSNQIFTETFHDNSMRFSAITLFYYAQYYSIKSRPLSMTFK